MGDATGLAPVRIEGGAGDIRVVRDDRGGVAIWNNGDSPVRVAAGVLPGVVLLMTGQWIRWRQGEPFGASGGGPVGRDR